MKDYDRVNCYVGVLYLFMFFFVIVVGVFGVIFVFYFFCLMGVSDMIFFYVFCYMRVIFVGIFFFFMFFVFNFFLRVVGDMRMLVKINIGMVFFNFVFDLFFIFGWGLFL